MHNKQKLKIALALGGTSILCLTVPAFAQINAQADGNRERVATAEEEIVVTARRREERLQDVPVAISVVRGDDLREKGIIRLDDLTKAVPAVQQTASSYGKNMPAFTIRSQRQQNYDMTQDSSVGIYVAEVVQARSQGVNGGMFDLQSMQVLKGPQGTLFGRSSTGGAIVISPQTPVDHYEGYASLTLGSYDQRIMEGAINIPVAEWLQFRLAGQLNRRDGFVRNLHDGAKLDDDHTDSWRASIRLTPTDGFENRLVLMGFRAKEKGVGNKLIATGAPGATVFPDAPAILADLQGRDFWTSNVNAHDVNIKTFGISNITTLDIGDATIKNIFGYRYVRSNQIFDMDGAPFAGFESFDNVKARQYSNEFQVLGDAFANSLNYIVGAYYFREAGFESRGNAALSPTRLRVNQGDIGNTNYSLFGQLTYKLPFVPRLSITGGIRHNSDKREVRYSSEGGQPLTCALRIANTGTAAPDPCHIKVDDTFKKITYTASVDWRANDDILVYAVHRQGYRSGGFNLGATVPAQRAPFQPETVRDYEIGIKSDWQLGEVKGRLNIAAYRQDYSDIQRQQGVLLPTGEFVGSVIFNAAQARIEGVEIETSITPFRNFEVSGFFSYSKPRYTNYTQQLDATTVVDVSASEFAGAPRNSGGGSVRWTLPIGPAIGDVILSGNVYSQSYTVTTDGQLDRATNATFPGAIIPGYTLVNARVEWDNVAGSTLKAAAFVNNLNNEKYYAGGLDVNNANTAIGFNTRVLGAPRTWGIELRYDF